MICRRQTRWWPALLLAGQALISTVQAQEATPAVPASAKGSSAQFHGKSPVEFFRQLLAMTPDERNNFLTNRPPEIRARILGKISEYEALDPNQRVLRLRATELQWYLMPLLHESPSERTARLVQIPGDLREIVQARLEEWAILPPTLQQEFLENEHILSYFAHVDASGHPMGGSLSEPNETERARWNQLSEPERRQVAAGFNQFFDLTPDEKQKTLNTLSDAEHRQMDKTLKSFEQMPAAQRTECVNAFARFASMSASERTEFLKNAERWSAMSPAERQAWRDLVVNVPQWPPLPIGWTIPTAPVPDLHPVMATNKN